MGRVVVLAAWERLPTLLLGFRAELCRGGVGVLEWRTLSFAQSGVPRDEDPVLWIR